jgi:triacylglycerol lipase
MTEPGVVRAAAAIDGWVKGVDAAFDSVRHEMAAPAEKKPVIIVAGTLQTTARYEQLAIRLREEGYPVYVYELPTLGRGDIAASADGLAAFANQVRAETGADKVDLVGHSQGGLVARQYVKFDGGADHVRNLVGLGVPNHGTPTAWAASLLGVAEDGFVAAEQMTPGSDFLDQLNEGDDTIGDVRYTSFWTEHDAVVFPAETAWLDDGATNVRIQDQVPDNMARHNRMSSDPVVQNGVLDALRGEPIDLTK